MNRILDATLRLLDERDYADITIAEIKRVAGTGGSSLYARFRDKRAILLAVHGRLREKAVHHFETLCSPDRWAKVNVEDALTNIVRGMLKWYRAHHNVLKASLLLNDAALYAEIAKANHAGAMQFALFIQDRFKDQDRRSAARSADFIFRIMTATFQQITIFGDQSPTKDDLKDEDLVQGIVLASLAQIR